MLLRVRRVRALTPVSTRWWLRATAAAVVALVAGGRAVRRVVVVGESMLPGLRPGDRVLAVRAPRPRTGDLVVVRDPRRAGRLLVKRVASVGPTGYVVLGDNPSASTDSRAFGPVPGVVGRVVYRYGPADRAGRLRREPAR
ncbi:MAG TPA: nickel-type superoxide dismutase maturation protease [Acidimicrobiales bacterium]|nr:nickel-type superoxide dismutase maturation protease [Acidimicrobiales bacterium]